MIKSVLQVTAIICLVSCGADQAIAQTSPPQDAPAFFRSELPAKLLDAECASSTEERTKSIFCLPKEIFKEPIVAVTVVLQDNNMSLDELKDKIRQKFIKKDKKIRIVSSESFAPNSAPNLIGFKALFEGKRGIKFIWAVADKHGWMDVTVIQVEGKNLADFNSEIGEKIFGPDRYPSEPATNKGSAQ